MNVTSNCPVRKNHDNLSGFITVESNRNPSFRRCSRITIGFYGPENVLVNNIPCPRPETGRPKPSIPTISELYTRPREKSRPRDSLFYWCRQILLNITVNRHAPDSRNGFKMFQNDSYFLRSNSNRLENLRNEHDVLFILSFVIKSQSRLQSFRSVPTFSTTAPTVIVKRIRYRSTMSSDPFEFNL